MPTLANVKVDGEKLREAIFERNLDFKDVHEKLGVAPGYIQRVIRRNTISAKKMVQLEKIVGIKREEYVLEDQNLSASVQLYQQTFQYQERQI